jgi:hypothetical protein
MSCAKEQETKVPAANKRIKEIANVVLSNGSYATRIVEIDNHEYVIDNASYTHLESCSCKSFKQSDKDSLLKLINDLNIKVTNYKNAVDSMADFNIKLANRVENYFKNWDDIPAQ